MKILKKFEKAIDDLTDYFIRKYFKGDTDHYWIGDEKGGVFYIADRFFDLSEMVDFIRYKYTVDQICDYVDYRNECAEKNISPNNIKNWLKLG